MSRQKNPKAGELRQWSYPSLSAHYKGETGVGEFFTVVTVDGVRVDVLDTNGNVQGYFIKWLVENSVVVEP